MVTLPLFSLTLFGFVTDIIAEYDTQFSHTVLSIHLKNILRNKCPTSSNI